jgi:type VI secretion system protein ImpH
MGLAGVGGVLPAHYTQLLLDRMREKDFSLRDFLDMFNDRLVWQFWHAWEKNRFYIGFERARRGRPVVEDLFTMALYSLIGMGTGGLRNRQTIPDDVLLYYSGHFAHFPRSAVGLKQIIGDYLQVPVGIRQFQEQWMYLQPSDWTRLGSVPLGSTANNRLGITAIAGERIRDAENKFRVRLGVLDYGTFCRYLPGQPGFVVLGQLTRSYVGSTMDFDLQLVLGRDSVPCCELARTGGAQLGWNTWLFSGVMTRDPDDAVFVCEGGPSRG